METLIAVGILAAVLCYVAAALREPGGVADRIGRAAYVASNVALVALLFVDWAHGSPDVTPAELAAQGHILPSIPPALAALQLVLLAARRWNAIWTAFSLSVLAFVAFVPGLVVVEDQLFRKGMLISFLDPAPVIGLVLAAVAPLLAAPAVAHKLPKEGTRLWRVAYGKRRALLEGIRALGSQDGWEYAPPRSILEAGSARGPASFGRMVSITTRPRVLPPQYTVCVLAEAPPRWPKRAWDLDDSDLPAAVADLRLANWDATGASLSSDEHGIALEYRSSGAIPLDVVALGRIAAALVEASPRSP